jgi:ubiquinone/menaquinone biosynthesis C-methylase UbiE
MIEFNTPFDEIIELNSGQKIYVFKNEGDNLDHATVESFGIEWEKFNYFNNLEIKKIGDEYFDIVDFSNFQENAKVLDVGCGSGRWSVYLSSKFAEVYSLDPSDAILSAANLTANRDNVFLIKSSAESIPFDDNSFDFVISLGVLHHIPNTQKALNDIVQKLKPGGKCLIYLYYSLDNRGFFYKQLFKLSNSIRFIISKLPALLKKFICDIIAFTIYLPFITIAFITHKIFGKEIGSKIPLSYYVGKSINVIRNDSLDRFGTPLEQRFSKIEIEEMMRNSGLKNIIFSDNQPYWHAIGEK